MPNELTVIENHLNPLAPRFQAVLGDAMNSKHLIQSVLFSFERNPKLFECTIPSVLNCAMTFANLRLPVDGATGQAFMLPFSKRATPVIGYKGFNTIAARSHVTITGGIVHDGDLEWDYREGTNGFVRHKKRLDNPGLIIAAWAVAESRDRPPAVSIMGIGELTEIMERSPAVRNKAETPWNDIRVGRPAMMEKSVKRRLSRVLPFEIDEGRFIKAARLDEAWEEQGRYAGIGEDGNLRIEGHTIEGRASPIAASEPSPTPTASDLMSGVRDGELEHLIKAGKAEATAGNLWPWWDSLTKPNKLKLQQHLAEFRQIQEGTP